MAYLTNQIVIDPLDLPAGWFFDDLVGVLQPKSPKIETFTRPGQRGETMRDTGTRAERSRIISVSGLLTRADHITSMAVYTAMVGGRYQVIQKGANFGYFKVEAVNVASELQPIAVASGYLEGPGVTVLQRLEWILISTDPPA